MKTAKRVCLNLIVVLTLIIATLFSIPSKTAFAKSTNEKVDLASSDVLLDLNDGVATSEADFNGREYEKYKDIHIIRVYADWNKKYNSTYRFWTFSVTFYLYVYNPKLYDIVEDGRNKIQYRIYNTDESLYLDGSWNKTAINFVNKTSDGKYMKYSVTVSDGKGYGKEDCFYSFNFAISGIELLKRGDANASEWGVGAIYNVEKINGQVAVSTEKLNTLDVDVSHTAYRTGYYDTASADKPLLAPMMSYQISSCWFSLPTAYSYGGEYGNLAEVTAEYERYKTKPVVVLNNAFKDTNVIGACLGAKDCGYDYVLEYCSIDRTAPVMGDGNSLAYVSLGYTDFFVPTAERIYEIPWLFIDENYSGNFEDDSYYFSGENLERFFNSGYASTAAYNGKSRTELKGLLFETPEAGKDGYQKHLYSIANKPSADDAVTSFDFSSIDEKESNKFWKRLFNVTVGKEDSCKPLAKFDFNDLILPDDALSKKYLIGKQDVADFKAFATEKKLKKEDVWLFRYDCCDYTGIPLDVDYNISPKVKGSGLFAREYVYLDFDILSFGFEQEDGSIWTIPVVHSPGDVFPDLTPESPNNPFVKGNEWETLLKIILAVLALIVVVFLIIYLWPYIGPIIKVVLKLLLWLITLPFKLLNLLIDKIKANKRKKKSAAKSEREKKRK